MTPTYAYDMSVNTDTVPPTVNVAPKVVTTPPPIPPSTPGVWRVASSGFLNDPAGRIMLTRGFEQSVWNEGWLPESMVDAIGRSGANFCRLLPRITENPPTSTGSKMSLTQVQSWVKRAINAKMLVDFAPDRGAVMSTYDRSDVISLMMQYEPYITVHVGESTASTAAVWRSNSIASVTKIRSHGFRGPIYVMSNEYGRNLPTLLSDALAVLSADPEHNLIFGWQAYWSPYYTSKYGMTINEGIDRAAAARASGVCIQVGMIKHPDQQNGYNGPTVPYGDMFTRCQSAGLGWAWWDWRMSEDQASSDGSTLTPMGVDVITTQVNGIARTSIRTPWLTGQSV